MNKKTQLIKFNKLRFFCGAAENRTQVQTSNQRAFYMLSFLLNFRLKAWKKTSTRSLALSMSKRI
jgi:hypothetical protein